MTLLLKCYHSYHSNVLRVFLAWTIKTRTKMVRTKYMVREIHPVFLDSLPVLFLPVLFLPVFLGPLPVHPDFLCPLVGLKKNVYIRRIIKTFLTISHVESTIQWRRTRRRRYWWGCWRNFLNFANNLIRRELVLVVFRLILLCSSLLLQAVNRAVNRALNGEPLRLVLSLSTQTLF